MYEWDDGWGSLAAEYREGEQGNRVAPFPLAIGTVLIFVGCVCVCVWWLFEWNDGSLAAEYREGEREGGKRARHRSSHFASQTAYLFGGRQDVGELELGHGFLCSLLPVNVACVYVR